ncbi:MAG TPA: glycoside hydrolase family 3 C-terminal domain-containing protein [Bacteroidales bacterium]|jgi:beta-glucosidase|nr:glycoside hydrolase family 3 C-terminal domain-containing protein [Bacteroidales bacterium]
MKKRITFTFLFISAFLAVNAQNAVKILPQLGKAPISKVISSMNLEEKAALVVGMGMRMPGAPPSADPSGPAQQAGPVIGQTQDIVPGAAGTTYPIPRLGIPSIVVADGPAGLRISPTRQGNNATYYCTAFPVATLLASTWDVDLVNSVGKAMGNEALEYGVDVILGPGMNIHRNPLCGRNFEYYSEDPLITGKMAAAMVNGIESNGVGTSVKHFAANNAETNRNSLNTIVSPRALREIYLKGFEIAVREARPWTVMSSYNLINGTYAAENNDLLTKVLRNDWGFSGLVMTDWFGGSDPIAMMKAGNDLLMPGTPNQSKAILEAVRAGSLDVKVLDRNIERILNVVLQSPRFKGYRFTNKPDLKAHAEVTRKAASEGMILLKNENSALPLSSDIKKIAAFGNTSYDIITGGTGSGDVNEAYSVSLADGLRNAGIVTEENLKSLYEAYLKTARAGKQRSRGFMMGSVPIAELNVNSDIINSVVNMTDAAIITIGRNSGEGYDRKNEKGDFQLTDTEQDLIKAVSAAYKSKGKKTIVILNIGGVIETASWKELPDAILLAWQAGQETGNSIADILVGKINPSGRLATTFPVDYKDVPFSSEFPGKVLARPQAQPDREEGMMSAFMRPRPSEITYSEGIYTGYRYYSTFNVPVSYEFGYGLSYTTFELSGLKLSSTRFRGRLTATMEVKNTGKTDGKDVVQLYISAPGKILDKPAFELKGFKKTKLLKPGESQLISFEITGNDLASFDPEISSWVIEKGQYTLKVGSSSKDIKLASSFDVGNDITLKKESPALPLQVGINELKPGK